MKKKMVLVATTSTPKLYHRRDSTVSFDNQAFYVKEHEWYILDPTGTFNIIWDSIVSLMYVISFFLMPLVLASELKLFDDVRWYEFVLDFVFIADLVLNFFTAYYDDVKLVVKWKRIARHYLMTHFIFDFIANIPGFLTGEMFKHLYYLKLLRYFQLNRFFAQVKFVLEKIKTLILFMSSTTVKNI